MITFMTIELDHGLEARCSADIGSVSDFLSSRRLDLCTGRDEIALRSASCLLDSVVHLELALTLAL